MNCITWRGPSADASQLGVVCVPDLDILLLVFICKIIQTPTVDAHTNTSMLCFKAYLHDDVSSNVNHHGTVSRTEIKPSFGLK